MGARAKQGKDTSVDLDELRVGPASGGFELADDFATIHAARHRRSDRAAAHRRRERVAADMIAAIRPSLRQSGGDGASAGIPLAARRKRRHSSSLFV